MAYKYLTGVGKIYYSVVDATTGEFGACKLLSDDVTEFGMSPKQDIKPLYGSDVEKAKIKSAKTADITISVNGIETSILAELTGQVALVGGGVADGGGDCPYVALQVELNQTGGATQYLTLFKGQFSDVELKAKTKTESGAEVQVLTLIGAFVAKEAVGDFIEPQLKTIVSSIDVGFVSADYVGASKKWGTSIIIPVKKTV